MPDTLGTKEALLKSNEIADTACIFGAPPIDANTFADTLTRAVAPIILNGGLYAHTPLTWALDTTLRTLAEESSCIGQDSVLRPLTRCAIVESDQWAKAHFFIA